MTRKTTAIIMIFWLLCQQAVAGVAAYNLVPSMPTGLGENIAMHCQESQHAGVTNLHSAITKESVPSALKDSSLYSHHSTHDCCDSECQCCVGSCTPHLVLPGQALYVSAATQTHDHSHTIAVPIQSINTLYRPPILS